MIDPTILIILYGFVVVFCVTVLTLLASFKTFENVFFRVLTGGTIGGLSSSYLTGVNPTLSFLEKCLNGDFGLGGYAALISTTILMGVWTYNIVQYRGVLVR
jgi:hypothetical protein